MPKKKFEEEYRPIEGMTFGMALEAMKMGKKVTRSRSGDWPILSISLEKLDYPQSFCIESHRFVANFENGSQTTWYPLVNHIMAEDWLIVE